MADLELNKQIKKKQTELILSEHPEMVKFSNTK